MGYDVHITRAEDWSDSQDHPISAEEWDAYAASDPTLRRDGAYHADSPHFFDWRVGGTETWLDWFEGAVYTKNPPQDVRAAMFVVATSLDARVQGDEGEWYGADGNVVADENYDETGRLRPEARVDAKPWSAEEIADLIAELEELRRRGEFDKWLDSFTGILGAYPEEIARYVEATPEFNTRGGSGLGAVIGRLRGKRRS